MSASDWTLDARAGTARHRLGIRLHAARTGTRYAVVPDPATVPTAGPGMTPADSAVLHQEIARRVTQGGQLLVAAMETARG